MTENKPFKCFVGWDARDHPAYTVAVHSLRKHASVPVEVIPLIDRDLRARQIYWRSYRVDHRGQMWDDTDGKPFSTQFSFTRFAVPILEDFGDDWVLFTDADVMWRADIKELIGCIDESKAVMCVKHDHRPREREKMDGVLQTTYERKNWSSVMLMKPARLRGVFGKYALNNSQGSALHGFAGLLDEEIGELDPAWNWLEGHSSSDITPKLVHYTRGSPDMTGHRDAAFNEEWWMHYQDAGWGKVEYPLIAVGA